MLCVSLQKSSSLIKERVNNVVLGAHSGKIKAHRLKLLDVFQWGGGSCTRRGGGQKVRYVRRNPRKTDFMAGYPVIQAGISRGPTIRETLEGNN